VCVCVRERERERESENERKKQQTGRDRTAMERERELQSKREREREREREMVEREIALMLSLVWELLLPSSGLQLLVVGDGALLPSGFVVWGAARGTCGFVASRGTCGVVARGTCGVVCAAWPTSTLGFLLDVPTCIVSSH
jgi:hypothetical protein